MIQQNKFQFFSVKRMVKIKGEYSVGEFLKMEEVLAESVCF